MGIVLKAFTSIGRANLNPKAKLFNDYLENPPRLQTYFSYLPNEIEKAIVEFPTARVAIPGLREYNQRLGAPDLTLKNVDILAKEKCHIIMSGQQPGLLLGPLYTLYKAIHIVKLARNLSTAHKSNFIPIFWNASEDDDWNEANHLYFLDREEGVAKIAVSLNEEIRGSSLGKIPLKGIGTDDFLKELRGLFPKTEFRDECLRLIDDSKGEAVSFSDWFSGLLLRLLGDYGLILFDPTCQEAKEFTRPLFQKEIEEPLLTNRLLTKAGKNLTDDGYKPQIHKGVSRCSLFLEENGKRDILNFEGDLFNTANRSYSRDELLRILDEEPERFTSDVALRPILASFLFPVLCYVAGPSELSYYAQLRAAYGRYNLVMPVIMPRIALSLIEARMVGILAANSLEPWELSDSAETIAKRLIREDEDLKIGEKFSVARGNVVETLDSLKDQILHFDPSLKEAFDKVEGKFDYEFRGLENKVIRDSRKRDTTLMNRLKRARESLYPNNLPQERGLNIFYFLVKYGVDFVNRLYDTFPSDYTRHHYLSIEEQSES